jgi:hypothetical protein
MYSQTTLALPEQPKEMSLSKKSQDDVVDPDLRDRCQVANQSLVRETDGAEELLHLSGLWHSSSLSTVGGKGTTNRSTTNRPTVGGKGTLTEIFGQTIDRVRAAEVDDDDSDVDDTVDEAQDESDDETSSADETAARRKAAEPPLAMGYDLRYAHRALEITGYQGAVQAVTDLLDNRVSEFEDEVDAIVTNPAASTATNRTTGKRSALTMNAGDNSGRSPAKTFRVQPPAGKCPRLTVADDDTEAISMTHCIAQSAAAVCSQFAEWPVRNRAITDVVGSVQRELSTLLALMNQTRTTLTSRDARQTSQTNVNADDGIGIGAIQPKPDTQPFAQTRQARPQTSQTNDNADDRAGFGEFTPVRLPRKAVSAAARRSATSAGTGSAANVSAGTAIAVSVDTAGAVSVDTASTVDGRVCAPRVSAADASGATATMEPFKTKINLLAAINRYKPTNSRRYGNATIPALEHIRGGRDLNVSPDPAYGAAMSALLGAIDAGTLKRVPKLRAFIFTAKQQSAPKTVDKNYKARPARFLSAFSDNTDAFIAAWRRGDVVDEERDGDVDLRANAVTHEDENAVEDLQGAVRTAVGDFRRDGDGEKLSNALLKSLTSTMALDRAHRLGNSGDMKHRQQAIRLVALMGDIVYALCNGYPAPTAKAPTKKARATKRDQ